MREGRRGQSAELLSTAQQERIDAYCRAELRALGSDFPYDEGFAASSTSSISASNIGSA